MHMAKIFSKKAHTAFGRESVRGPLKAHIFLEQLSQTLAARYFQQKREICMQESNIFLRGTRLLCVLLLDNSKCSEA